ncbi:MAG: YitT family protein [Peptococcaceae bacterium]|nr:YitT family protein [Peptococcaceae bacterium]MDH7524191.1 YitT family protein [Peptococcaceae bacterium]
MKALASYAGIAAGSVIFALSLNFFFIANGLAEGGLTGLALIAHYLAALPTGLTLAVLNVPLLLLGWSRWGVSFIFKTLLSVLIIAATVDLTQGLGVPTHDLLLGALYGGAFSGVGTGIVLRSGATTGGIDVIARFIHEKYGISMGKIYFSFDFAVLTLFALLFGLEKALYTLVALFVFSQVIDRVIEGVNGAKAVIIISRAAAAITQDIINKLDRGATVLRGYGAYTGRERDVLYVVVGRQQLLRLKKIVQDQDPHAFVIVNDVHEVLGEGFRRTF